MKIFCKVVVILGCLVVWGCNPQRTLVHAVGEKEANALLEKLSEQGISSWKVPSERSEEGALRWDIQVASSKSPQALKVTNQISKFSSPDRKVPSASFFATPEERAFSLERTLSFEIENTLLVLPGIIDAKVHLRKRRPGIFMKNRAASSQGTASVLLIKDSSPALAADISSEDVARLVSGASGIAPTDVQVLISTVSSGSSPPTDIKISMVAEQKKGMRTEHMSTLTESYIASLVHEGIFQGEQLTLVAALFGGTFLVCCIIFGLKFFRYQSKSSAQTVGIPEYSFKS